jgi:hypothetical protein
MDILLFFLAKNHCRDAFPERAEHRFRLNGFSLFPWTGSIQRRLPSDFPLPRQ